MKILSETDRLFIQQHLTDDVAALLLRPHSAGSDVRVLAAQIAARQKARSKLPAWYANASLVFPPALSVEQASSEATAQYKASLVSGGQLLDLTGGMGVDTWAFAGSVGSVVYVERNAELVELAAYNLAQLGATNVQVETGDGLVFLDTLTEPADWIYLDPHRRDERGGKVVLLDEYEPNVLTLLSQLAQKSRKLLLKVSPMIDLKQTIRQLGPAEIHIVAVQGEVKEVLLIVDHTTPPTTDPTFVAVNRLATHDETLRFTLTDEEQAIAPFGDPQAYLYEPNAAVLKAGAFRLLASRFGLTKLAPNSHLYTSEQLVSGVPGRAFRVDQLVKPDRKSLQAVLPGLKANLAVRNFPQTVAELRRKLSLRDGGDAYLFATTLLNGDKRLIITHKVDKSTEPQPVDSALAID
ncbi:THUMP-like domain-containing protein [Spirosoma rhododendri]|uniref:SAM-dependent methyltransferase n=1 Tax=Spirosoma rhododendri TaxID=2728024 RepID=A0A7L5DW91_9BACT|nr:SAM-dependent methyltransferase [Spirosoma rhododendri]QJD79810.1 SAM-dependent methyltransferase [Spirosoma rhododendri]